MPRCWRILNLDDEWENLEEAILARLLMGPKEALGLLGVTYGSSVEETSYLGSSAEDRFRLMLAVVESGSFPLGLRLTSLSHAWTFIEKCYEKGLTPDLCFLDIKMDKSETEEAIGLVEKELREFVEEKALVGLSGYVGAPETRGKLLEQGGLFVGGKIRRTFQCAIPPPQIVLYSSHAVVHEDLLPLMYMENIQLYGKDPLFADWQSLVKARQLMYIREGLVSQAKINEAIDKLRLFILANSTDSEKLSRSYGVDVSVEEIGRELASFLSHPIGNQPDHDWTMSSFFILQLNCLLQAKGMQASGHMKELNELIDLISSVDHGLMLTLHTLPSTHFDVFGHRHDPTKRFSRGVAEGMTLEEAFGNQVLHAASEEFVNEWCDLAFSSDAWGTAMIETVKAVPGLCQEPNTLDYIKQHLGEVEKLKQVVRIRPPDLFGAVIQGAAKALSQFGMEVPLVFKMGDESREVPDRPTFLEAFDSMRNAGDEVVVPSTNIFSGMPVRQVKSDSLLTSAVTTILHSVHESGLNELTLPGNVEICIEIDPKHWVVTICQHGGQPISRNDLAVADLFRGRGGLLDALRETKHWIGVLIRSDNWQRNPHCSETGREAESRFGADVEFELRVRWLEGCRQ